eukprot:TRINITY_DN18847_c0_g1_i1.p1 TRINITY_DN18847_c0_g1~~TRINITY_DN18847_c0_g1_i1.p1  ORF type:complete len:528 (+),score=96.34 TRINITY_DN18847_c0_g1_i1:55-1584(+)
MTSTSSPSSLSSSPPYSLLDVLDADVLLHIFSHLDVRDVCLGAMQTCWELYHVCISEALWWDVCKRAWGDQQWKDMRQRARQRHNKTPHERSSSSSGSSSSSLSSPSNDKDEVYDDDVDVRDLYKRRYTIDKAWIKGRYTRRVLNGHTAPVRCVKLLPHSFVYDAHDSGTMSENATVLSGSDDKTIKQWDHTTGECVRTITGHTNAVTCLQIVDSTLLSGSSDYTIKTWDFYDGKITSSLEGHTDLVTWMQCHTYPQLVSCSYDATIRLWDLSTSQCVSTLRSNHSFLWYLQLVQANVAAVGASSRETIILDLRSNQVEKSFAGHKGSVYCLQNQGRVLITGSGDDNVHVYDMAGVSSKPAAVLEGHTNCIDSLQFKGSRLITGSRDRNVRVWNEPKGWSNVLQVIDSINERRQRRELSSPYNKLVENDEDIFPGGITTSIGKDPGDVDGGCGISDNKYPHPRYNSGVLSGHTGGVWSVCMDDDKIVSASDDTTVRVWDYAATSSSSSS